MKQYKCEYPNCEKMSTIRSKVKDQESEYYGLYVCNYHANLLRPKKVSEQSRRTREVRKESRKEYPEFYQTWCEIASKSRCEECGAKLRGDSSEIAHIIMKSTNPEIAVNGDNIILLCGFHSKNKCHSKFDSNLQNRSQMKCFQQTVDQYHILQSKLEKHTHETLFYEKYTR